MAGDPNFSSVSLLLHGNGTDASTTFTDSALGATATVVGNAQIDTAQSKFGGASMLFDGTGDYLTFPDRAEYEFGAGDFTIDAAWVRFNALPASGDAMPFVCKMTGGGNYDFATYLQNIAGIYTLRFGYSLTGTDFVSVFVSWTPSTNTWYHLAWVRSGTGLLFFVDGTQQGTTQSVSGVTVFNSTSVLQVGLYEPTTKYFNGWIDDLRITKGVARYTANFTPPTAAYPNQAGQLGDGLTNSFLLDRTRIAA